MRVRLLPVVVLVLATCLFGQTFRGTILGTVTDPSGAVVAGATITVKNPDGTTTDWVFTTGSATTLADRGISKVGPNALKSGEPVTAKFIPARNGNPLGFLKSITKADGTVITISAGNPND